MSTVWKVVSVVILVAVIVTATAVLLMSRRLNDSDRSYRSSADEVTAGPVATAAPEEAKAAGSQSGIAVVAQGEIRVKPDVAYVNLGVRTTAPTARVAMDQNNAAIAAVIARLETLGVAKKDMQTGSINLYPQIKPPMPPTKDEPGTETIAGYLANNMLNVTVNDLSKVGEILDAAISAGANTVGGVRLGVKDDAKLRDDALSAAVKNARPKADLVAAGLGLKVTGVESVSVENLGVTGPMYDQYVGGGKGGGDSSVPVETGELIFTASVRVVFAF